MQDILPQILFYVFAGLTVLNAVLVITQNNPVRCVLFLVLAFLTSSVLWMLAEAEFLALILVLVYVGAVMTLFLFVVMMLNIDLASAKQHLWRYMTFGLILVATFVYLFIYAIPVGSFQAVVETKNTAASVLSNTEALGLVLYTDYVFAFELAAVLLLVAIIAAITLVHRGPIRSKRQNVVQQMMTRPEDRVQLVKLKAERMS